LALRAERALSGAKAGRQQKTGSNLKVLPVFVFPFPGDKRRGGKPNGLLSRGSSRSSSSVSSRSSSVSSRSSSVSSRSSFFSRSFFGGGFFFNGHGVGFGGSFFSSRRASDGGNGQTSNGDQSRKLLHGAFPHKRATRDPVDCERERLILPTRAPNHGKNVAGISTKCGAVTCFSLD